MLRARELMVRRRAWPPFGDAAAGAARAAHYYTGFTPFAHSRRLAGPRLHRRRRRCFSRRIATSPTRTAATSWPRHAFLEQLAMPSLFAGFRRAGFAPAFSILAFFTCAPGRAIAAGDENSATRCCAIFQEAGLMAEPAAQFHDMPRASRTAAVLLPHASPPPGSTHMSACGCHMHGRASLAACRISPSRSLRLIILAAGRCFAGMLSFTTLQLPLSRTVILRRLDCSRWPHGLKPDRWHLSFRPIATYAGIIDMAAFRFFAWMARHYFAGAPHTGASNATALAAAMLLRREVSPAPQERSARGEAGCSFRYA